MKLSLVLMSFIFFISCNKNKKINLSNLNGYWEIDYVIKTNGQKKQYNYNEFIDFFKTNNNNGFRAKVKPSFNGTFSSNKQKQYYSIECTKFCIIHYKSPYNETLIEATKNTICLQNTQGDLYFYKPYIPINIQ